MDEMTCKHFVNPDEDDHVKVLRMPDGSLWYWLNLPRGLYELHWTKGDPPVLTGTIYRKGLPPTLSGLPGAALQIQEVSL